MKIVIITSFLLFLFHPVIAQEGKKVYQASRVILPPKIDGILDDEAWKSADVANAFLQNIPDEGKPATQNTEVRIVYDNTAVYVSAMLYDNEPDKIYRELGVRDAHLNSDWFRIAFDTYHSQQDAYFFDVYASGVQRDTRLSDMTYDAVWESKTRIYDTGWSVEMRIPYSAFRFPSTSVQEWGMQSARSIVRHNEFDQWALVPKGVSNALPYWGVINGISDIKSPVRLSLTPFVTGYYENAPYNQTSDVISYNRTTNYNYGADLKYGLDERFTLDVTLLPDFSQVQSDNKIKSLSYDEVVYSENRSFFKEGTEIFNRNQLFYSRRIGKTPSGFYSIPDQLDSSEIILENPSKSTLINAVKLSGRDNNGFAIGFFNAITDDVFATIQNSEGEKRKILTEPLTNYNMLVFDKQMKNNSNVYFINTNVIRDRQWDDANVSGAGMTFFNKEQRFAIDAQGALSQKFQDNDSLRHSYSDLLGYRYFVGLRKAAGSFQYGLSHTYIDKTYDSRDMGNYVVPNKTKERIYLSYNFYNPTRYFRNSYNTLIFDYGTNPLTGKVTNNLLYLSLFATLPKYWTVNTEIMMTPLTRYDYDEPRVDGWYSRVYRFWIVNASVGTDSRKALYFNLYGSYGDFLELFHGEAKTLSLNTRYRINDKLQLNYNFLYYSDSYSIGFADILPEEEIIYAGRCFTTYENNINIQYIIKNDLSLNLFTRHYWNTTKYMDYYTLQRDGSIIPNSTYNKDNDFSYNTFNIDFVFSWQFAPGSNISLAYKNFIETEDPLKTGKYFKNFDNTIRSPQSNSISLRLLYYLDYNFITKKTGRV